MATMVYIVEFGLSLSQQLLLQKSICQSSVSIDSTRSRKTCRGGQTTQKANIYLGDFWTSQPEHVLMFSLVKYHQEASSEAQISLRRSRYSSPHLAAPGIRLEVAGRSLCITVCKTGRCHVYYCFLMCMIALFSRSLFLDLESLLGDLGISYII